MILLEEATRIRNEYCGTKDAPIGEFIERPTFWWLEGPHKIGGQGLIIDKADGHILSLGTGCGLVLEEWFFVYSLGFRHLSYSFRITKVRDEARTLQLLSKTLGLQRIPASDIQIDWRTYRYLPQLFFAECFDSRFIATGGCDEENCAAVGTEILDSTDALRMGEQERNIASCFIFPEEARLTPKDVETLLDNSLKERCEKALAGGKLRELAEEMAAEGLSPAAVYHRFDLFTQFLFNTGRDETEDFCGSLYYIRNAFPSDRWFKDFLTNYEIVKYRKALLDR
jgi:hypothetical protein